MIPFEAFYWRLKQLFPGDADFSVGRYGDLSYGYVLNAIRIGVKMEKERLYQHELPIAQQTALLANQQRDVKKKIEPYQLSDFSFFKPIGSGERPSGHYGSAALAMIKAGTFPSWALFCFKQLSDIADPDYVPGVAGLVSEDAILLHPTKTESGYKGLLIARESAGNSKRDFVNDKGDVISLFVPPVHTKTIAEEDVTLYL